MILNNSFSGHLSPNYSQSKAGDSFSIHFHLQYTPMAAILKNGCNFGTNSASCMFIDLTECSHDFEQLLSQAFFFYLFTKQGLGPFSFTICAYGGHFGKWLLWPPGVKSKMAQYPNLFTIGWTTSVPNLVLLSKNAQQV